jgi:uncharacterized membrane protein
MAGAARTNRRTWLMALIVLVLLAGAAAGGAVWWYYHPTRPAPDIRPAAAADEISPEDAF